ncbi:CrcB family protein [Halobium salinum]|uniref:Fluoride-specific ion channel FluC n=1 Tax=Halobium salinum TaxID=1364940 RepID=A0ABD5PBE6_9EURY|nr:CrcB family protein [Halobium salinum]
MQRAVRFGLIAAGGFVGASLRYAFGLALPGAPSTLAVNVLGSFALGALVTAVADERVRLVLATGLLSSFTTYSTFAVQTVSLGPLWGGANVAANYALGFAAAYLGLRVGGRR